jgi:hypothetical protein
MQWWEVERLRWWEASPSRGHRPWWGSIALAIATVALVVVSAVTGLSGAAQPGGDDQLWEYQDRPACLFGSPDCLPECIVGGAPGDDVSVHRRPLGSDQEWTFWRGECRLRAREVVITSSG